MKEWWVPHDILDVAGEVVIPQTSLLEESVDRIVADALALSPSSFACPARA